MRIFYDTEFHERGPRHGIEFISIGMGDLQGRVAPQQRARAVARPHRRGRSQPDLWAYYADYDHVVLAQLFGRMVALPSHMPMYSRDLKQAYDMLRPGYQLPQQQGDEHNALADAHWVRDR